MLHRSERRAKDLKNVDDQEQFRITDQNTDWSEQIKKNLKVHKKEEEKNPESWSKESHECPKLGSIKPW